MNRYTAPAIAIVGHPNKGKSSLVASLTEQSSVPVSPVPGTTTRSTEYPMHVDSELLYTLVDTPGFQRSRRVLEKIRQFSSGADDRRLAVETFLENARNREETFPDEVELLTPIMNGAGILYVVDGAVPYSEEYEAELEILRWTGQPRMAVINPIGAATYEGAVEADSRPVFQCCKIVQSANGGCGKTHRVTLSFFDD